MNKSPIRSLDLKELFSSTGFLKNAFALFEQGSVNMLALEEFNEHSARVLEISEQLEDLLEAKKHLLFAIDQLDEKSRAAFEDTFSQVRSCFKKNFSPLFEGGEADLHLVGQKDLLQAGIEVVARPPGKSFRPLTLFS